MVIVTGHRGCGTNRVGRKTSELGEPENTIRSFLRAVELGADRVELDIHASADGELVVIHDETVDRTTNGHGYVCNYTVKQLKSLRLPYREEIPTLNEVIDALKGKVTLQIELKGLGVEEATVKVLQVRGITHDVVITSFRHDAVKRVRALDPRICTGVLFSCAPIRPAALALDADAGNIHPNVNWVTKAMVDEAHQHGLGVYVWNADTSDSIKNMASLGVDGIGTNRLDIAVPLLRHL
jgi:glycerophosphoryl diester phosphodiesterase